MSNLSLDIQQVLEQAINEAPNLNTALNSLLHNICEFTHWDYGEVWIPCKEGTILELYSAFYITPHRSNAQIDALEQFRICTKGFTFPPGVGLPGRVWSSQQPEWLPDACSVSERVFLRNQIAKAFGVKTGFGIPLVVSDRVLAVLVFFMLDAHEENQDLIAFLTTTLIQVANKLEKLL
ncbi:GAF domain-containing protein [Allocoleopsis sp.]|uniref:GAF domain-containing protein n=1 Tax=Allocoleopsis sp. TaxID=3088169 RepID=UPI002FD5619F